MAIKHIPHDGSFEYSKDFGFHGSAEGAEAPKMAYGGHHMSEHGRKRLARGGHQASGTSAGYGLEDHDMGYPEKGGRPDAELNRGQEDAAFAHGGQVEHPHGHRIVHTSHRPDGSKVHRHSHGGHSVEHADGGMTHHLHDGTPLEHMSHGGGMENMHDSSEYAHRARGGHTDTGEDKAMDDRQDKAMIKKAFSQHDKDLHGGEHEELHLARGGRHVPLPHGMRVAQARHRSPIGMPVNRAPRNPNTSTSMPNDMAGGQMAYGNQPSSEPDVAGSEQGIPQMNRGGRR